MNIKSSKNKKIVPITTVAALIVLFAFLAMCTPIQGIVVQPPVNPPPNVSDIPDQSVPAGESFATIILDDYLEDNSVDSEIIWTTSGASGLTVVIDADRVATITYPAGWSGSETIRFTATDPGDLSGSDDATFTVNQPPDVTAAYPSIDCLWPPNHNYELVDITIEGVTDPDGDSVTITITKITSDEPTASIEGAGGDKHAPDADPDCIGSAIASVRAERSGTGNGRVYEITFVACDGKGEPVEGTVQVKVPHDQSGDCVSIDDGQDYDATEKN